MIVQYQKTRGALRFSRPFRSNWALSWYPARGRWMCWSLIVPKRLLAKIEQELVGSRIVTSSVRQTSIVIDRFVNSGGRRDVHPLGWASLVLSPRCSELPD